MQYCNNCGKEIPINSNVCSYCGSYFNNNNAAAADSTSTNSNKRYPINTDQQIKKRPLGITVISILFVIGGVFSLIGILSGIQGIVSFVFGIVYIIVGGGLWKGKSWSWSAFIILTIVGVIMSIISIAFIYISPDTVQQQLPSNNQYSLALGFSIIISIEIGISLLLIYYFYRPRVKEFFGKL
jgi:zinc-ribbon domain